ncbi:MAG: hypothetical protein EB090_03615 [Verrucomicrobia bacterium]|nr:hypothetical protein [Verrucomicrobiota bacterium]
MSSAESRLHSALSEYLTTVRQGSSASSQAAWSEKLKSSMVTLEKLETELGSKIDPRVRHFMESKSYRKAHDYLATLLASKLANPTETRQNCRA